ncbi:MAG: hypothetical protein XU09_C0007G0004 [Thaumarchaeota archaeon CSP1-1]|nr:MAG: hypothetical protein XU09_C0007G0004 [Thaumarchaeota archaeon CSP1-1]
MKVGIILVLVIMSILTPSLTYGADSNFEFGTRFIPTKLVEDKEGMIHIFAKKGTSLVPEKIPGLTVTSLDSKIIRVLTVKDSESGFVSEVTVKGIKAGTTKLFLAAPGFSSQELPVTVYGNVFNQEQLLVKVVPDTFSSAGPFRGLVSVELADADGFPVKAAEDVSVSLSVANNNILDISQENLVIKKGEYFTGTHFIVKDSGNTGKTNIFVTALGMETKSDVITVDEQDDLQVKLYLVQEEINTFGSSKAYIIVQLQLEGSEEPVIASKDITVKYKVTNDIFANQNTSPNADIGDKTGTITIKKGSYWGYDTFSLVGGKTGEYLVTITSGEPLTLESDTIQAVFYDQNVANAPSNDGDRFVKFEGLPIFATGNKELLGIIFLEDESDFPIRSDKNLEIKLDSSDNDFLSIDDVFLQVGEGSALVFGKVGHSIPNGIDGAFEINPVVEVESESSSPTVVEVFGSDETSLQLIAEPLITKVLKDTEFPIVLYFTENSQVTKFPKNSNLFVSPSKIFDVETKPVFSGDDLIMLNTKAIDSGSDTLQFTVNDFPDATLTIESLSLKPANIIIDHSETIFTGTNDVFSVQLVNSQNLPVFATEDIEITFVVNDESMIQVPHTLTIKKGEYYTLFDAGPKTSGVTEISALSEGLPLSTTNIKISSLTPSLLLNAPEIIESGEVFTVKIEAKQDDLPLSGLGVQWNVDGGILQLSDSKTGTTGEAIASIISTSGSAVNIKASVSSSYYSPSTVTKTVRVNSTSEFLAFAEEEPQFIKPEIGGIDPVIIIVPSVIILMGYILIKKGTIKIKNPTITKQVPI